jgi:uncharacterized protein involved in exopolysaccharide biosynthesis
MQNNIQNIEQDEISLKELILKIQDWYRFLISKWIVLLVAGIIGGGIGVGYALIQKPTYTANLSFALEDEKQGGVGLSGALGLASSLGIDLGTSAGGAFSGANLIELMKSRKLVEETLLSPITVNGKEQSLVDYYLEFNKLKGGWEDEPLLKGLSFPVNADRVKFSLQQDSILFKVYKNLIKNGLSVLQKDKKITIMYIEINSINEQFAKTFCETIAKVTSEYYTEIKSKKSKMNVDILQHQTDSIRGELNSAISGVALATDNVFNLNSAMNVRRIPSSRRQVDVQGNSIDTSYRSSHISFRSKKNEQINILDTWRIFSRIFSRILFDI